jgi:hypothetical protein
MRLLLLFVAGAALAAPPREFVLAVEFPYYLYPRNLWERELVWLKTIGVRTVEFSVPWSWHQTEPGSFDFTGATSPRRDLVGLVRLLRQLDLRAWVRPLPPVAGMANGGWPAGHDARTQRAWLKALDNRLATQTVSHGGPIAFVEGRALAIDAPGPPGPLTTVSANDPGAYSRARQAIGTARGTLLWEDVEDSVFPAGWAADPANLLHKGAVALDGTERAATTGLRRDADLLREWLPLLPQLEHTASPKPATGRWPNGVSATQLVSPRASALSLTNRGSQPFTGDVRVFDPAAKRTLTVPGVRVPAGESLWLPVGVSIGPGGLCRNCTGFSPAEHIVYATAELHALEYENGILAMEFAAPVAGEVILQLMRQPVGPFLAGGKPTKFDFDEKALRARLPIPAGAGPAHRVRIGLAIEAPEMSAFFVEAKRLVVGKTNLISTSYSSEAVAARSRLKLPEGWTARPKAKSPLEIDYEVDVPPGELHGDWANLAIEADGLLLGRARLQLFRPASIRWTDAIRLRLGAQTEMAVEPPLAPADARTGRNVEIVIRNNTPQIQTYRLDPAGEGLTFAPVSAEISIGAAMERAVSLRVFPEAGAAGLRDWRLRVSGGATADMPMRLLLIPRGQTVTWSADLDGDGSPEWVIENQKVRAVFSTQDGGRWTEFTWKDTGMNFLPEGGAWAAPGRVEVQPVRGGLEFAGKGWRRTVRLTDGQLTVEQTPSLPADNVATQKRGGTELTIARESAARGAYVLH